MDCITYQKKYDRNIILSIDKENYDKACTTYKNNCNTDKKLRAYEPELLVHSTTLESWDNILKCGCLKSWNHAKADGDISEQEPIGNQLGDPKEFRDYIMLGGMGAWNELVVLSKQMNKLSYDMNKTYIPGAKLYFDSQKIAEDGILVRDGVHLKVKDVLSLKPYMIWAATSNNCHQYVKKWTPLTFSTAADNTFLKLHGRYRN